jgi:hypothetical protein
MTPTGGEVRIRHFLDTFQRHTQLEPLSRPHVQPGKLA